MKMMSHEAPIEEAPEPSNIVWEDVGNSKKEIFKRSVCANLVITALLFGAFFLFGFLRLIPIKVQFYFP